MTPITYEAELRPESRAGILEGLVAFNRSQNPDWAGPRAEIGLLLKHPETDAVEGGLTARIGFGWMFIEYLFVPERLRGEGLGKRLMAQAETKAREQDCTGIWLDTFSFQARPFYEKLGFTVFGEIGDYPPGKSRFFLQKRLGRSEA